MHIWSDYQKAIYNDVQYGSGHVVVEALAGSSKTTTLLESLKYIPPGATSLLVAFNKRIADELKLRAPPGFSGNISTLHSLGLKSIGATFRNITVDADKCSKIIHKLIKEKDRKEVRYLLEWAVGLCKGHLASTAEEIDDVMDIHDIDCADMEREEFINHVIVIMDICKAQNTVVDFSDMVWFPNVLKINVPKYDRVFLDEGQDVNKAQLGLVLKAVQPKPKTKKSKPEGRIMIFLDPNQAIYSWAGSDINSVNDAIDKLNAKKLPLSISYRCPLSVTREAQKIVPHFEAAPNAIEGKVEYITIDDMKKNAKPGCVILSRVNAPLIGLAMHFIKNGVRANIQGRDIGQNLIGIITGSRAKSLDKFLDYLGRWQVKQVARLTKRGKDVTSITDRYECLTALSENINSIHELKSKIEMLFSDTDDSNRIILSSVHKFKGFERDVVYMLLGTFRMNTREEINIKYVGVTRSKRELYLVTKKLNDKFALTS